MLVSGSIPNRYNYYHLAIWLHDVHISNIATSGDCDLILRDILTICVKPWLKTLL